MDFAVCGIIPLGRVEMKTVLGNFGLTIPFENRRDRKATARMKRHLGQLTCERIVSANLLQDR